ncbi:MULTISPECIES: ATPase, T2SS/T4P/T4SS family [Gammaproteobacteria]|uniref:Response regulator n=1 Tax=Vreelandella halophila TaxID=86177 RepID=A0A9X4YCK9_9GAMM|nr:MULTISPECIES: ATPase, T2SS/T4P/T4SS family [Gammaproteobacteria]KAA8983486.1 response regulator [Halospina sp. K52047b]MYL27171.1 response regulator [Halomonas utahensis]MYL74373.1 response regulator [Halomonas sp. 22501_18_FS]
MSEFDQYFLSSSKQSGESEPDSPQTGQYRLLFVDDEPNVLSSLRRTFHRENYGIQCAASAEEALALVRSERFHLMITDFKMPGMNGADLLREVREISPDTMRIMLTGHADTQAVMTAINEGAVYRFILKPWNDDDLRVTVALALEQYELREKNRSLEKTTSRQEKDLDVFRKMNQQQRSQLALMLHKHGLINRQQVQEVYKIQQARKVATIRLLLEKEWVSREKLYSLLRDELLFDEVALAEFAVDPEALDLIPADVCQGQLLLPLRVRGRRLVLAMADPLNQPLIEELSFAIGLKIEPVLVRVDELEERLGQLFGDPREGMEELESVFDANDPGDTIELVIEDDDSDVDLEGLLSDTQQPSAVRVVNAVIMEGLRLGASDIHIQPRTNVVVVRYRIDGVLQDKIRIPSTMQMSIVSRIKVMSELDITERRRPQDGRLTVKTPMKIVDLRLSTLPTLNGEKVVMRVLDRNSSIKNIDQLALSDLNRQRLLNVITRPQGIILATGPTGSGKTTTLYAMLQHQATPEKNYVTIEDPVEFYMDMAGQVPVREKVGLDFASVLRAILRQDPDVILLGEIRDRETAEVAFHAAMTGHMVYSTLHTNSAIASVARLLDLGLKPYVVAYGLECVISQRLVRRLCPHCREPSTPDPEVQKLLGPAFASPGLYDHVSRGCDRCHHQGFKGRVALHEVLSVTESMRHVIASGGAVREMVEQAESDGLVTLAADARYRVEAGETNLAEILRVLGSQIDI